MGIGPNAGPRRVRLRDLVPRTSSGIGPRRSAPPCGDAPPGRSSSGPRLRSIQFGSALTRPGREYRSIRLSVGRTSTPAKGAADEFRGGRPEVGSAVRDAHTESPCAPAAHQVPAEALWVSTELIAAIIHLYREHVKPYAVSDAGTPSPLSVHTISCLKAREADAWRRAADITRRSGPRHAEHDGARSVTSIATYRRGPRIDPQGPLAPDQDNHDRSSPGQPRGPEHTPLPLPSPDVDGCKHSDPSHLESQISRPARHPPERQAADILRRWADAQRYFVASATPDALRS